MAPNNSKPYSVRNVAERVSMDEQGRLMKTLEVTYVSARGNVATVSVPLADASPDNVKKAIEQHLSGIEAIYNL